MFTVIVWLVTERKLGVELLRLVMMMMMSGTGLAAAPGWLVRTLALLESRNNGLLWNKQELYTSTSEKS